jgi:Protein of unknown function (DUF3276)
VYDNNDKKNDSVYSKRIRAGKRRTYFFDVRATRGNDYYLTITESRKRFNDDGYDRHKVFLYKEDFNKFIKGLGEAVDYVKTELMPDFNFDAFNHDTGYDGDDNQVGGYDAEPQGSNSGVAAPAAEVTADTPPPIAAVPQQDAPPAETTGNTTAHEEVDKW